MKPLNVICLLDELNKRSLKKKQKRCYYELANQEWKKRHADRAGQTQKYYYIYMER